MPVKKESPKRSLVHLQVTNGDVVLESIKTFTKVYEVLLEKPVSVNGMFFTKIVASKRFQGRSVPARILTSEAKEFKTYCGMKFIQERIPKFDGTKKIVFEVWGIWPNRVRRDLSNYSKPILDAFKECGYVPDDNVCLWREQDWKVEKGVHAIRLRIYQSDLEVGA